MDSLFDTKGIPKVTAMELTKTLPRYFSKRTRRHRPAGVAPKVKKAKETN